MKEKPTPPEIDLSLPGAPHAHRLEPLATPTEPSQHPPSTSNLLEAAHSKLGWAQGQMPMTTAEADPLVLNSAHVRSKLGWAQKAKFDQMIPSSRETVNFSELQAVLQIMGFGLDAASGVSVDFSKRNELTDTQLAKLKVVDTSGNGEIIFEELLDFVDEKKHIENKVGQLTKMVCFLTFIIFIILCSVAGIVAALVSHIVEKSKDTGVAAGTLVAAGTDTPLATSTVRQSISLFDYPTATDVALSIFFQSPIILSSEDEPKTIALTIVEYERTYMGPNRPQLVMRSASGRMVHLNSSSLYVYSPSGTLDLQLFDSRDNTEDPERRRLSTQNAQPQMPFYVESWNAAGSGAYCTPGECSVQANTYCGNFVVNGMPLKLLIRNLNCAAGALDLFGSIYGFDMYCLQSPFVLCTETQQQGRRLMFYPKSQESETCIKQQFAEALFSPMFFYDLVGDRIQVASEAMMYTFLLTPDDRCVSSEFQFSLAPPLEQQEQGGW